MESARQFDYSKLWGKVVEKYHTCRNFANALGVAEITVGRRLNGKTRWRNDEILDMCELLDIPKTDIQDYFFKEKE